MVLSMFRQAWDRFCRERGLLEYQYSKSIGFHASKDMAKIGQKYSVAAAGRATFVYAAQHRQKPRVAVRRERLARLLAVSALQAEIAGTVRVHRRE